jgi:hypothetical protein
MSVLSFDRFWLNCDRSVLSCDRFWLSCDRFGLSCERFGLSCDRSGLSCDRFWLSCDRSGLSCDRFGVNCNRTAVTQISSEYEVTARLQVDLSVRPFEDFRHHPASSGVYICKSIVNYLRHGNYICKSEEKLPFDIETYRSQNEMFPSMSVTYPTVVIPPLGRSLWLFEKQRLLLSLLVTIFASLSFPFEGVKVAKEVVPLK